MGSKDPANAGRWRRDQSPAHHCRADRKTVAGPRIGLDDEIVVKVAERWDFGDI